MDLLERDRHLDALGRWLREATAGQGRLVLIGGEAGVGKTALVECFCRAAHGRARVLRGACDALFTPHPLGPLHDIAAGAGGDLARALSDGAPRDRVFRAALAELGAGLTPTVAVVEDAHWADEATFDLLRFLGRRLDAVRALLVVTYRDDEVGPRHPLRLVLGDLATKASIRRLEVAPLSEEGIRALAAGSELDPTSLHRQTGGNPFFATEALADKAASSAASIPATVSDAVLARASRLAPAAREALDAASVIGSPISRELLAAVSGATAKSIEACLTGGMLVGAGREYAFRHELARRAIYDAISPPRRRELHAAVLSALRTRPEVDRDVTRLAHHAEEAGDRQAVLTYAPAAARSAVALGANREAIAQYARALRFCAGIPDRQRLVLLEAYADVADLADWSTAGIAPREEMIALARRSGDRLKEAEHLGWLSITLDLAGRRDDAERSARAALVLLDAEPEGPTHATFYCNLAELGIMSRDITGAVAWAERAIALAERHGDVQTLILALNTVGEARLVGGDEERGRGDLERCLQLAREAGFEGLVAGTLAHLGTGHGEAYRFDQADRYLAEAIAYATEHDLDGWRHWSTASLATIRLFQGRWTEASDLAASVLRVPTFGEVAADDRGSQIVAPSYSVPTNVRIAALLPLGRVRARRGNPEVEGVLDEARSLAEQIGNHYYSFWSVSAARAEAAWLAGDRRQTASEARAAFDLASERGQTWLAGELAYWRWKAGDRADPPPSAAAPYALQVAGDWAAAAAAWDSLGCRYEAARALAEGDDQEALNRALVEFDRLGARPAAAAAARRLREFGSTWRPARSAPEHPRQPRQPDRPRA